MNRVDALEQAALAANVDSALAGSTYKFLLLEHASDPGDPATLAFAGAIARGWATHDMEALPILGLNVAATRQLLGGFFPGAAKSFEIRWDACSDDRFALVPNDEFDDLLALLLEHRTRADRVSLWVAHTVATGCMGADHLWQDMSLPDRTVLSALLERYFASLAAKNAGDMKWKKFFYKQLCDRAEVKACAAPSCGVCVDYRKCFGPEDG